MTTAELHKYLRNPGLLNRETLPATESLIKEFPAFDLGWALWVKNLKNIGDETYKEHLPLVAIRVSDRKWLKKYLESPGIPLDGDQQNSEYLMIADYNIESEVQKTPPPVNSQEDKMSLIENFLSNGGDFQRKSLQTHGNTHSDLAERAVTENDDIVTETFANILLSQGQFEKAVTAFEKLSLKYPEKSIYFAARIEKVKSLLNL
jgi:hypothetical protein